MMMEVTDVERGNQQAVSLSGRIIFTFRFPTSEQPRSARHNIGNTNCEECLVTEASAT
jgi:hypothetical protein